MRTLFPIMCSALLLAACGDDKPNDTLSSSAPGEGGPLLEAVGSDHSGITFNNTVTESAELNYFTYIYSYNGGGVAVGDIDNDGLPDLYFTGNQVPDRLYKNKGGLQFEDITEKAIGSKAAEGWRTGVSMADVNGDGFLDIYVCRSGPKRDAKLTSNLLYLNKGDGTFREAAGELGIADTTHSTQAAFFDQDRDGDLDLYVMNDPDGRKARLSNFTAREAIKNHTAPTSRFYRNVGTMREPRFVDATYSTHVASYAYGLGLSVADLDKDGWPDIYQANDFDAPDLMYINQGPDRKDPAKEEVGFGEQSQARLRHMSNFGMGCDVADYNNDLLPDIMVLDMTADDHVRNKTNMGSMSPETFWSLVRGGYFYQYMVNTLQLNNGNGTWSEVAQMAGVARTDWSWAALFCDLDNDGWKDLMVTNGYKHDVRNNDYLKGPYREVQSGGDFVGTLDLIPSTRLRNYLFRNNGDLTFGDSSLTWGFDEAVNSNGAAYADLDNDGDLDLVLNNIDAPASLYRNNSDRSGKHWLRLSPVENGSPVFGTKATLYAGGSKQYQELFPVRGFQSCVEPVLHFGLGATDKVDSVVFDWPDGTRSTMTNVAVDKAMKVDRVKNAPQAPAFAMPEFLFTEASAAIGLQHVHKENAYNDFELEPLLPHKQSEVGSTLGSGDADGNGKADLFIGGGHGQAATLFLQGTNGMFRKAASQPWDTHAEQETVGSVFFDADKDGDQDLLVLAGGNEEDLRSPVYAQRLYLNDGKGAYAESKDGLPPIMTSSERAAAADIDGDGDQDLFIGGRQTPAHYPQRPRSYLLANDGAGHFVDVTEQMAPAIMGPGMVTSVVFADIDNDQDPDLLLAGEWMSVMALRNDKGRFTDISKDAGLAGTSGWWQSLTAADLNGDGFLDIIGGNIGWNAKFHGTPEHPSHIYWADFDDNGRHDIVLAKEKNGKMLPVRGRECSSQQCPMILDKFKTYADFANADLAGIYTEEKLKSALHLEATTMRSTVFLSNGKGGYTAHTLPNEAQMAPINGSVVLDVNGDGRMDIVCAGNNWGAEVETVRYDAGIGNVLLGDGKGGFTSMPPMQSGFFAWGNAKDVALLRTGSDGANTVIVSNNNDMIQAFRLKVPGVVAAK